MKQLNSNLGKGYSIIIGKDIAKDCGDLISGLGLGRKIAVVTNPTVAKLHLGPLVTSLKGFDAHIQIIPEGEEAKSLKTAESLITSLLQFQRRLPHEMSGLRLCVLIMENYMMEEIITQFLKHLLEKKLL